LTVAATNAALQQMLRSWSIARQAMNSRGMQAAGLSQLENWLQR